MAPPGARLPALVGICLAAALLLVGAQRLGRDIGRPRLWLAAIGVGLLLVPLALGPVVGVHKHTTTLSRAESMTPGDDITPPGGFSARDDAARIEDLPPDARVAVRHVVEGKQATADRYDVSVFGQAVGSVTVTHDVIHSETLRWPEIFLSVNYVKVDGQWYWISATRGLRNPMPGWRTNMWALSLLPAVLVGYLGTRPTES